MKKLTTEEFICKAIKIHGEKYNYDKVQYIKSVLKVIITCPLHGDFEQSPNNHLHNRGCQKCSGYNKNTNDYIKDFNRIHNNKYDYSLFKFEKIHKKVKIICKEHGIFNQSVTNHLIGKGCQKCCGKKLSLDEFILACDKVHNKKYDYSLIVTYSTNEKIKIICAKHGEFEQKVGNHKHGQGCPDCAYELTKYDIYKNQKTTLYYIRINDFYKIGLTRSSVESRFKHEIINGIKIQIIKTIEFEDGWEAFKKEQQIIKDTKHLGISKEESPIKGGWSEIRNKDILEYINNKIKG